LGAELPWQPQLRGLQQDELPQEGGQLHGLQQDGL